MAFGTRSIQIILQITLCLKLEIEFSELKCIEIIYNIYNCKIILTEFIKLLEWLRSYKFINVCTNRRKKIVG